MLCLFEKGAKEIKLGKEDLKIPQERFDKRVLRKPFLAGMIKKEQIDAYLQSLPDLANETAEVASVFEPFKIKKHQEVKNSPSNK